MGRMSVATIDAPEFINITSINPLISKCEIKVLYVGENRNRSFISKEVATSMAQTLPGSPIVGYYRESDQDFFDHGDQVIIDGDGIKFKDMTRPYGFVAPDSRIWFQKFEDTDEFGNSEIREYLMTEGYLWTGQYEECKRVIEEGNPQSMKLNDETLKGYWATDKKSGIDFFIINDAVFQNLCILGESVEPCFEGADVTAPKISSNFSKDGENFTKTLYSMMQELKFALNNKEGGEQKTMENENITPVVEEPATPVVENPEVSENFSAEQDKVNETAVDENQNTVEEFAKGSDKDENEDKKEDEEDKKKDEFAASDKSEEDKDEDEEDKKKKEFELLQEKYSALETEFAALKEQYDALVEFKNNIDNEKKDELIQQFYMLSEEDKKDVIENKSAYSLEDIEAKLSVICVRKKVNFSVNDTNEKEDAAPITYNLNESTDSTPAWLKAVEATQNRLNK